MSVIDTASSTQRNQRDGERVPSLVRRAVRGGVLGNYVDQFDIFLPVIVIAPASATLFGLDNIAANAGLVFVATLLGRPLGALIFGPISDRVGRTKTTRIALAGVAIATLLIAFVPEFSVWGGGTLATIVALRFVGGIFLGGEYSSAVPLAMEWARPRRRGAISGAIMSMSPLANATIAALVLGLVTWMSPEAYSTWGWRIPFVFGAAFAIGMLIYYSKAVSDSVSWAKAPKVSNPLKAILVGEHRKQLVKVFVLMSGLWLLTYMSIPVLTGQLQKSAHVDAQSIPLIMLCATAVSAVAMLIAGHVSTGVGRRNFFIGFGVIVVLVAPVSFLLVFAWSGLAAVVVFVVVLQLVTVTGYGPVGAYIAEQFPAAVRSSGYGVGYSLSIVIPALYPYYLPPLQDAFGDQVAVVLLIALGGALVIVGGLMAGKTKALEPLR